MVTKKEKYTLKNENIKKLMQEFSISKAYVSQALNLKTKSRISQLVLKRAIELGAKKQIITITEE